MKLEQVVPPLELCAKIPDGAFADSALVWEEDSCVFGKLPPHVVSREENTYHTILAPAPTLQEIMEAIDQSFDANLTATFNLGQWVVEYRHYPKKGIGSDNFNPATAALKLWLEVSK